MKKIIIVLISIIVLTVVFIGCFEDTSKKDDVDSENDVNDETIDSRFIGEWKFQDFELSFIFRSNGSFYGNNYTIIYYIGSWKVKGNQLCTIPEEIDESCFKFDFSNDNKTLTLYVDEDNPTVLTKQ